MPTFRVFGEIEDYRSYKEYSKLHTMKDTQLPILRKMKRHIVFSEEGLIFNHMVLTEEVYDASEQNSINHDTCIHMIIEDGEKSGDIISETFEKVSEWCRKNGWSQVKEVYINMLLISENNGQIHSYLELYGPVKPIK